MPENEQLSEIIALLKETNNHLNALIELTKAEMEELCPDKLEAYMVEEYKRRATVCF